MAKLYQSSMSLSAFWESAGNKAEHEEERRKIQAAINDFIREAGRKEIEREGLALLGRVHHIRVDDSLGMIVYAARRKKAAIIPAAGTGDRPKPARLILTNLGGLVSIRYEAED